jgi:PAS domain-containing protein
MSTLQHRAPNHSGSSLRNRLAEVVAYAGAGLVIAAAILVLAQAWPDLTLTAQVGILAGIAVVLLVAGLSVGGFWTADWRGQAAVLRGAADAIRRRLASTLLTGGALAAALSVGVWAADSMEGGKAVLPAALTALSIAAIGWLLIPTPLAELAVPAAGLTSLLSISAYVEITEPYGSVAVFALAVLWASFAALGWLRHRTLGLGAGLAVAYFAALSAVTFGGPNGGLESATWVYVLLAILAVGSFGAYVRLRDWPLVGAGLIATVSLVVRFITDVTDGSGAPFAILLAGLLLLGGAGLAWRLRPAESDKREEIAVGGPDIYRLSGDDYHAAFLADPLPLAIVDSTTQVLDANPAFALAMGQDPDGIRGSVLDVLLVEHPAALEFAPMGDDRRVVTLHS